MKFDWKEGGIYKHMCGAVSSFYRREGGGMIQLKFIQPCSNAEHTYCMDTCAAGSIWRYAPFTGLWEGQNHNKDFHLHVVKEIVP